MSRLFRFAGPLPPSKSILIRYLLLRGYAPQLVLPPLSGCAAAGRHNRVLRTTRTT